MYRTICVLVCVKSFVWSQVIPGKTRTNDGDYNSVNTDGSFDFGYANKDIGSSYHVALGNANKVVGGRFGSRDAATGTIKETIYTAGPRGFRAKGPNIHRKMDLDQRPRGPIGNKDDPYADPSEDPSYGYRINTRTFSKAEDADSRGDVKGHYSYVDDVGERHEVSYIAGKDTGFQVTSAHPDSPSVIGNPFHRAPLVRGESKPRGRTAVHRGLDGSYRFISAGPDQRRSESSDANGNVRGSYTFLDDKGVQRTVHYIAGPGIGYRIVKNGNDPYIPPYFPTIPSAYDPDFITAGTSLATKGKKGSDDVFKGPDGTAASGHVKPSPYPNKKDRRKKPPIPNLSSDSNEYDRRNLVPGNQIDSDEKIYVEEESAEYHGPGSDRGATRFNGAKPSSRPISRRPSPSRGSPKPFRPTVRPYVPAKPSQNSIETESTETGSTESNTGYEERKDGPEYGVGYNIKHSKSEGTVIKNIGEDYFGVPPGVSVRAHVQSIDLYPYDSKPISPSEALEKDHED